jgi:hypothetical protein
VERCSPTTLLPLINAESHLTRCASLFSKFLITPRSVLSTSFGGVYLGRIHASYPYIMSRLSGLRYCWLEQTCLDNILHLIHLDTDVLHDVIAWYCFTVFCWPTPRLGCQVQGTHGFCLTERSSCLSVYDAVRPWIRTLFVTHLGF